MFKKDNFRLTIVILCMTLVCSQEIQPQVNCSQTSTTLETRCETITIDTVCPKGFILNDDEANCILNADEINCSEFFEYNGTSCVYRETLCVEGYSYNEELNECEVTSTICPHGYYHNGETCEILNLGRCGPMYEFEDATQRCVLRQKICVAPYDWDEKLWKCVKHEYTCPNGFRANSNGKCEQIEIVCPTGFERRGSECQKIDIVCPENLTYNGSICIPSISCPDEYVQRGSICVRDIVECPINFKWNGNECILKAICPTGYDLDTQSNKCIKTETCTETSQKCTISCNNNYKLIEGLCYCKVGFILPNGTCIWDGGDGCPPGYVRKDERCQPEIECPVGFDKVDRICVQRPCPPGHVLVNGVCQKRTNCFDGSIYIEGVGCVDCPPGTSLINNNYCLQNITDKPTCDYGYRWDGRTCVSLCSPGLVYRDGFCVRYCQQGILLPNGLCIQCAPDHVFNGQICVKRICGPGFIITPEGNCIPSCNAGEVLQNGECVTIRCQDGHVFRDGRCQFICPSLLYKWKDGRCVPIEKEPQCGPGFRQDGNTCIPIVCPEGYELRNNGCVPIVVVCLHGEVYRNGRCESICGPDSVFINGQCVPQPTQCPPGYEKDNEGRCNPRPQTCPSGYIYQNGRCESICGPDSVFINGQCVPQPIQCPPGYEKDNEGKCRPRPQPPTPPPCPSGYIYQNGRCVKPECPINFIRDVNGNCIPIVCPIGTHLSNGVCTLIKCPDGYYLENNECHRIPLDHPIPPTGSSNCTITSTGRSCTDSHGGVSTVHNYNVIEHPTNITVMNVNTIGVYLGACKNGQFKTVVISGNTTEKVDCEEDRVENEVITNDATDDDDTKYSDNVEDNDNEQTKCCNVVSPRVCEKRDNEWVCFNRKRFRCGSFCVAKTVLLSPSRRDCTACIGGGGYRCVHECYRQLDLCENRDCSQVDYDSFCAVHGAGICW